MPTKGFRKDHGGEVYGKLTAVRLMRWRKTDPKWLFKCECGQEVIKSLRSVKTSILPSCSACRPKNKKHYAWRGAGDLSSCVFRTHVHAARAKGLSFELTILEAWQQFQKQDGKCAYTGWELYFNKTNDTQTDRTASLDRIDSSKGYSSENIQWVHRDINKLKRNFSSERFIAMCKAVANSEETA